MFTRRKTWKSEGPWLSHFYKSASLSSRWKPSKLRTCPGGWGLEHLLKEREVVGSDSGCAIPKALICKQLLPFLVLSIMRQVLVSLLLATAAQLTSQHTKGPIIINVCIHRRTVWMLGSHARYVILLKYRDYYYYYYYYYYYLSTCFDA